MCECVRVPFVSRRMMFWSKSLRFSFISIISWWLCVHILWWLFKRRFFFLSRNWRKWAQTFYQMGNWNGKYWNVRSFPCWCAMYSEANLRQWLWQRHCVYEKHEILCAHLIGYGVLCKLLCTNNYCVPKTIEVIKVKNDSRHQTKTLWLSCR